jgi:hypothetical protein
MGLKKLNPMDENALKNILNRIYASANLENLSDLFGEGVRNYPKYHDLLNAAMEEKGQELTKDTSASFEVKENKVRKTWLIIFCVNYILNWLSFAYVTIRMDDLEKGLGALIAYTGMMGIMMGVVYYCAYHKKGTGLLTWILFISPLQILMNLAKEGIDLSLWYITAIDLALFGLYWFSSFRLRKINCEVKARQQLADLKPHLATSNQGELCQT